MKPSLHFQMYMALSSQSGNRRWASLLQAGQIGGLLTGKISRQLAAKPSFTCTVCGKDNPTSAHLRRHMRSHSGEKPFECALCQKRFANHFDLYTHRKRVHHAPAYQCGSCSESFTEIGNLRSHQTTAGH